MGLSVLTILAAVMTLLPLTSCDNYYVLTMASEFRLESDFRLAITNIGTGTSTDRPLAVRATIGSDSTPIVASGSATVRVGTTAFLPIKIGNWPSGEYRLNVIGTGGAVKFNRTVSLSVNLKTSSLFIQTDKGSYQAGQTVNLRVISVNSNLQPFTNRSLVVFVNDANGNRIKQWNTDVPASGIFEGELPLSTEPVLGEWTIEANVLETTTKVSFSVTEFVSPRFIVSVAVPPYITSNTVDFPVIINAKTIHGRPITGTYLLKFTKPPCGPYSVNCKSTSLVVRGDCHSSGSTTVTVRTEDLNLGENIGPMTEIAVLGQITELSTGISESGTATLIAYRDDKELTVAVPREFIPTLPLAITIALTAPDGSPVTVSAESGIVEINYEPQNTKQTQNFALNKDGTVTITVTPPEETKSILIIANYSDVTGRGYLNVAGSLSNRFISISAVPKRAKVGQSITINVQSTFPMERYISYQVTGRGDILLANTIALRSSVTKTSFTFKLTSDMSPQAVITVFYVNSCGEIVSDSITVTVDGLFRTPLTFTIDGKQTQPGNNVTLSIKTSPFTTVAITSVVQSLLILDRGNDLTQSIIYGQLDRNGFCNVPDDGSLDSVLKSLGLLLITNGAYYKSPIFIRPFIRPEICEDGRRGPTQNSVTTFFPGPWFWTTVTTNANGVALVTLPAPDTNTSVIEWSITGFAINIQTGLGITEQPTKFSVYKPFYVTVDLPYQVIVGESLIIDVFIYNFLQQDLEVTLTMTAADGQDTGNGIARRDAAAVHFVLIDSAPTKKVKVNANDVGNLTFPIRTQKEGFLIFVFTATSTGANYVIKKPFRILPQGVQIFVNKAVLVDLRTQSTFKYVVDVNIPSNVIDQSSVIKFDAIGNILAKVLNNLNNLLRIPTGCGEQNMVYFVPNVIIYIFLEKINRLTPDIGNLTRRNSEIGYQRELTFRFPDGSFGAWGPSKPPGSLWLTTYVLKSFLLAQPLITIDVNVISTAKQFIVKFQQPDGSFVDNGNFYHFEIQGGTKLSAATLTAFVVIAFLETTNDNFRPRQRRAADDDVYQASMQRAVTYLENNLNITNDAYSITIVSYALHLGKSRLADEAFKKMKNLSTTEGTWLYWNYNLNGVKSINVEATSYALLTYAFRNEPTESQVPIVTWLVANQDTTGAYSSTQDTVLGIQALGRVGPNFVGAVCSSVQLNVDYGTNRTQFDLDRHNELVIQQLQLPSTVRKVQIVANGTGVAISQVQWNYYAQFKSAQGNAFDVTVKFTPLRLVSKQVTSYTIRICSSYKLKGRSGMVTLQLYTLSGFIWTQLPSTFNFFGPERATTANEDTLASVYFNSVTNRQVCVRLAATQAFNVTNLKNAYFNIYRYYNPDERTDGSYNIQ